ncbi:type II toxin-antitoxin system RelE/ParE family toxin [Novosphingobium sp.]|uniref:type II toxin-antitoxin system RelE/ParE family toxin n=1 Tax=Novosphingobium sp. TaxID=1874826 RepID=UPI00286AAD7B|nr:type II toxin-antitoxin system RelE/ParE family toxin [Novosphingobium sp.]
MTDKIELVFFKTLVGNELVRDWLIGLPLAHRREIGLDLQRVQYRWPIGMPLVRPIGKGLFEVRTALPDGTIARVMFCFEGGVLFALHGFIKKTQATPASDLEIARKRQKDVQNG